MASDKNGKVSEKVKGNDRIKPEDKLKALETALTQIKKQFGEGAVMRLGQNNTLQVEAIPTGSLSLDLAEKLDIVQKSGAWFSYNGTRIGQGRENAKKFLQDNPDIFEEITERVKQNADKLYLKTAKGEGKPVVSPVETAPMPEEKPVDSRKVKADIDITVDDDE